MNKQKWMTAVAVLTLSASLAVAAPRGGEGHGGHGHKGHGRGDFSARFAEKLNLTDAQKQQFAELQKSFREQNKPLLETSRQTRNDFRAAKEAGDTARMESLKTAMETQRAQFKQAREAQTQSIVALLTPDQRAQWDAMKAERKDRKDKHQR